MPYTERLLPADEYYKLEALGIPADRLPDPATSIVGVVEKDGQIVSRWMAVNVIMFEGLQTEEAYRGNPVVARRMFRLMIRALKDRGVTAVTTIVQDDQVGTLARQAGFDRLPGTLYQKDLRGEG